MDEYIVQNYLARVGRSYYGSEDFDNLHLSVDPISRFGIGILSCFMVSKSIEIDTCRDYTPSDRDASPPPPLHIVIPAIDRQFRVSEGGRSATPVGTTVRVPVDHELLAKSKSRGGDELRVAQYLSAIAGFVDVPIIVNEDGIMTLILHPSADPQAGFAKLGASEIAQVKTAFPWSRVESRTGHPVEHFLREERIDLQGLGLSNVEGSIVYLVPRDQHVRWKKNSPGPTWSLWSTLDPSAACTVEWDSNGVERPSLPRSAAGGDDLRVYNKGILVPRTGPRPSRSRGILSRQNAAFGPTIARINLTGATSEETDVSRTELRASRGSWVKPIMCAHAKYVIERELAASLSPDSEPHRAFADVGRTMVVHRINASTLLEVMANPDSVPVALAAAAPDFCRFVRWGDFASARMLYVVPTGVAKVFLQARSGDIAVAPSYSWTEGEPILSAVSETSDWDSSSETSDGGWGALELTRALLQAHTHLDHIRLFTLGHEFRYALPQAVWAHGPLTRELPSDELLGRAHRDPARLSAYELASVMRLSQGVTPAVVRFAGESAIAACGRSYLNVDHPAGSLIVRVIAFSQLARRGNNPKGVDAGALRRAISSAMATKYGQAPADKSADLQRGIVLLAAVCAALGVVDAESADPSRAGSGTWLQEPTLSSSDEQLNWYSSAVPLWPTP